MYNSCSVGWTLKWRALREELVVDPSVNLNIIRSSILPLGVAILAARSTMQVVLRNPTFGSISWHATNKVRCVYTCIHVNLHLII